MNPDQQRDELVDDLLDRWEDAFEAGNEIGVKALCADHPELVDTVRSKIAAIKKMNGCCLLYTSPSPRDQRGSRMPSSA